MSHNDSPGCVWGEVDEGDTTHATSEKTNNKQLALILIQGHLFVLVI